MFHPNPMDGKTIGEIAEKYHGTILVSTPTFYAGYIRKCRREQFAHVRYALVGAEKLREPIAAAFQEKFGITLLEGYGCTEMSPVVAVNAPDVHEHGEHQRGSRAGTVGHPLPGVVAKVVDPETGEGPLIGQDGLLLVNGPNRMQGYLGEPERTAEVLRDGWYVTGDIACIDEAGFIRITDRRVALQQDRRRDGAAHEGRGTDPGAPRRAVHVRVTAVPDDARGERLVAFYTDPGLPAADLWERLCRTELPRLWLPKREDLRFVDAIPSLGTGKVDLRAVRQLATPAPARRWPDMDSADACVCSCSPCWWSGRSSVRSSCSFGRVPCARTWRRCGTGCGCWRVRRAPVRAAPAPDAAAAEATPRRSIAARPQRTPCTPTRPWHPKHLSHAHPSHLTHLTRPSPSPNRSRRRIGGRWLLYIGIVAIVIGVAYFEKLAIDNNWIGETARVIQGGVFGASCSFTPACASCAPATRVYGQMITGGGVAVLYRLDLRGVQLLPPDRSARGVRADGRDHRAGRVARRSPQLARARAFRGRRRLRDAVPAARQHRRADSRSSRTTRF